MTVPTDRLIRELARPKAYPRPVTGIQVLQTHISVVFLAGDLVYKVKKPVDFGFLDFTTLPGRRRYCEEEVRLNRRLSPEIYLGVVPVTEGPEGLRFGEPGRETGTPVEYAVLMKRLDDSLLLSSLLPRGGVSASDIEKVAEKIAAFHLGAETSPEITRIGGTEGVITNTEENFRQIRPYIGDTLEEETFKDIVSYTRAYLEVNADLLSERENDGWIRDGHGDLHTQHICMTEEIQIFDCIEFNERFRYGDVLVDAAFLAMDLERLGHGELAGVYKDAYLERTGQTGRESLFNFYACYRAVVRGKVEGFRSRDADIPPREARTARESARAFFRLARGYARTPVPPVLVVACGLMGTGKSTVASALGARLDLEILSSDRVRKELAGLDPVSPRHVPFGADIYTPDFGERTYAQLHDRARGLLSRGRSVFIDASYMKRALRQEAAAAAGETGARLLVISLEAGEEQIRSRLRMRVSEEGVVSDGREEILRDQMKAFEPPSEVPGKNLLVLDASASPVDLSEQAYRRLLEADR